MNTPSLSVSSSATANGASSPPPLPRFLIEPTLYGFVIRDTLLGQPLSRTFPTATAAHTYLTNRFKDLILELGVAA